MPDHSETINTAGLWIVGLLVLGTILLGFGSCVERDWRFENACRAAGGYVTRASAISASEASNKEVCAKVVQSPVSTPIPLPEYKP